MNNTKLLQRVLWANASVTLGQPKVAPREQAKPFLGTSPCLSQVSFQNPMTQFLKVNWGIEPQFVGLYSYVTAVSQDG